MNGGEGALFRVDPMTGNRTVLSDFGDANQGPTGIDPFGVAVESTGQILVSEQDGGNGECHALFRIDPVTGNRTILSDFGEGSMGDNQCDDGANDVAVESTKKILILFDAVLSGGVGLLYRVDQNTGDRVFLSDFRNDMGFTVGQSPRGVAVESNGQILATGIDDEDPGPDALFRIDPVTGVTTILSNFGNGSQGAINGIGWEGLAVEGNGTILVAARTSLNEAGARGKLYRVNPMNGNRTLLSDFNDGNQGPTGKSPLGVAVVPPDTDGDGEFDNFDNCPDEANANQADADGDGVGDVCDNCPDDSNEDQADTDTDPGGLIADGVGDVCDNCPDDFNPTQADLDEDGSGDACDNTITCQGKTATIVGSAGKNTIYGTLGPDVIHGLGGDDTIHGVSGNDVICGGNGIDKLFGDSGNDKIDGGNGIDGCNGGSGIDMRTRCEINFNFP
ncbi:MAG: thrombospondin type 3 repeat-containing protein [Candidatus Dadabacteria bacterium]|nr:thrombospondin type 3 repeat-containing protein [Candidatus Dadabacteria bacterium]